MSFDVFRLTQQVPALILSGAQGNTQREALLGELGQRLRIQTRGPP